MAAPYSTILHKVDRALVAYLLTKSLGTANIYTFKASPDKDPPCVICHSETATEEDRNSGNWVVKTAVMVLSTAGVDTDAIDPATANLDLLGKTFDAIMQGIVGDLGNDTTFADLLSAQGVEDFTVYAVSRTGVEQSISGDCWVDTINLEIKCQAKVIA